MPSETYQQAYSDSALPKISYGLSYPETCAKHASSTFKASRIFILASGTLSRNTDAVEKLVSSLGGWHQESAEGGNADGKVVGIRKGMKSHTQWTEVLEVTEQARAGQADLLITLGAGSLTDAAKIVALALANNATAHKELWDMCTNNPSQSKTIKSPTVPIISIPTSLSGGEFSSHAGAFNDKPESGKPRKQIFHEPIQGPSLVILDPELCTLTPASIWLSTGVRSVDHCVETLCSLELDENKPEDAGLLTEAREGLAQLVPSLITTRKDPSNVDARLKSQLGVIRAMKAVVKGVELGGSHAIGHQLGPLGVGHGETSCILLPAVCKFNMKHAGDAENKTKTIKTQSVVREILLGCPEVRELFPSGTVFEDLDLGDILDVVIGKGLGMPRSLRAVNVTGEDKIELLAENSLTDHWAPTNPVPLVKKEQVVEILRMVEG